MGLCTKTKCRFCGYGSTNMQIAHLKNMYNRAVINEAIKGMREHKGDFADFVIRRREKEMYGREVIRFNNKIRGDVELVKQKVKDSMKSLKRVESDIEREMQKIKDYRRRKESQNRFTKKEYKLIKALNEISKRKPVKRKEIGKDLLFFKTALLTNN
eukprot:TRINITY_DN11111_c0_g1_i9.p1 TRINITY_DN11111_c0_g1~~TRINITY_DN11111_c0_g1_i9.p1  ORF type:complete len:157 (+),score=36.50 TRINITY_DN11111_c0_g1_i9:805-1275(+)